MAITVSNNSIQIGSFTLSVTADGLTFDGKIEVEDGVTDSTPSSVGTVAAFNGAGQTGPTSYCNAILRLPFAADNSTTNVGNFGGNRAQAAGASSLTSGFVFSGICAPGTYTDDINCFAFASSGITGITFGELQNSDAFLDAKGHQDQCGGHAYIGGGDRRTSPGNPFVKSDGIQKFAFASTYSCTDVGILTNCTQFYGATSSPTDGYAAGGFGGPPFAIRHSNIDKFPFTNDVNATCVGALTIGKYGQSATNSTENGYSLGGECGSSSGSYIMEKFPFAADGNAVDIGDLAVRTRLASEGSSSTTNGYMFGGDSKCTVEKHSFASDANSVCVADIGFAICRSTGHQQ